MVLSYRIAPQRVTSRLLAEVIDRLARAPLGQGMAHLLVAFSRLQMHMDLLTVTDRKVIASPQPHSVHASVQASLPWLQSDVELMLAMATKHP